MRNSIPLLLGLLAASRLLAQPSGTAQVRHGPVLNGRVEGSVQQMTAEDTALNGSASVSGDLLVPGTPAVQLNGHPAYGGTLDGTGAATPASHKVTLNGSASLNHVVRRTDATALPAVTAPPQPPGTRSVSFNNSSQTPGDFATLKNLTLNGNTGPVTVPPGTYGNFTANGSGSFILGEAGATTPAAYDFQSLTLNGSSHLDLAGPVVVTLANGMSANGGMGVSGNPAWLTLRISGGGLTLNGSVSVYGFVTAPNGPVTINGNSQLVGGLIADRLTINGNGLLRLLAPPTANQPPSVALTAPADGASYTAPAAFTLTATATDADGAIAKVEFYQGTTKLGEDTSAPYELSLSGVGAGGFTYLARATDNTGSATDSAPITLTVAPPPPALPFLAGFEPAEGYHPGPVDGQKGWTATSPSVVTDADFSSGTQSVLLPGGEPPLALAHGFPTHPANPVVFIDLFTLPQAAATEAGSARFATLDAAQVAFVRNGTVGRFAAFNGDGAGGGAWQATPATVPVDAAGYATAWIRVTLRIDYATHKWDLYIGGVLVAADLGFANNTQATLGSFTLTGQATAPTLLDDFLAGFDNPLFADADHDGMDDAWETAHGLNPAVNDRNGDPDGDGLTNLQEYVLGTDPSMPNNAGDADNNGLPDAWEVQYFGHIGVDPYADPDGDGLTNLQEYQAGSDPNDFYNGVTPQMQVMNNGAPGPDDDLTLMVLKPDGSPWPNAPGVFQITAGGRYISATQGGPDYTASVRVTTDAQGQARVYLERLEP